MVSIVHSVKQLIRLVLLFLLLSESVMQSHETHESHKHSLKDKYRWQTIIVCVLNVSHHHFMQKFLLLVARKQDSNIWEIWISLIVVLAFFAQRKPKTRIPVWESFVGLSTFEKQSRLFLPLRFGWWVCNWFTLFDELCVSKCAIWTPISRVRALKWIILLCNYCFGCVVRLHRKMHEIVHRTMLADYSMPDEEPSIALPLSFTHNGCNFCMHFCEIIS